MKKTESVVMTTPLADIYETADAFVVKLDMPGATKESISITLDASSLVVRSVAEAQSRENTNLLYGECGGGNYHRSFNLTNGVNRENVEAQYDNGVLTLKLFKKEELKLREIRIN
jgi:HSP20 family protein